VSRLFSSPSQTVGPFFHMCLTCDGSLGRVADPEAAGEHIRLRFRLLDGNAAPVPDGVIELWQADASGRYHPDSIFRGFGRLPTAADGSCTFETIRPGRVADGRGGLQAAHINVSVFARGLLARLFTRVYFEDDPALAEDAVLALVPAERRATLLAARGQGVWTFDIHLQGDRETVFFDI
jgi:protocatechuate 3,4-dioxygenase, alpha subunit